MFLLNPAVVLAEKLLNDEIMRVCLICERERGQVQAPPGVKKSHGYCKRHYIEMVKINAQMHGYRPADAQAAIAKAEARPDVDFPLDMSKEDASAAPAY